MKTTLLLTLVIVSLSFLNCSKDRNKLLEGQWVEVNQAGDTLVFETDKFEGQFELKRGKEWRGEYLLPKYNSGYYSYLVEDESISVKWMLSSSSGSQAYYFKIDEENEQLKVGNFFIDSLSTEEIFVFEKK